MIRRELTMNINKKQINDSNALNEQQKISFEGNEITRTERRNNQIKKHKKKIIIFTIVILIYFIGILVFGNAFPNGTTVNGIDVSGYTPHTALSKIKSETDSHIMTIQFGDGKKDMTVSAITLGASFNDDKAASQLGNIQSFNKWLWPISIFKTNNEYTISPYDYNDDVVTKTISRFPFSRNITEPKNAYIGYDDTIDRYILIPEEYGTDIDNKKVIEELKKRFSYNEEAWNVLESQIYEEPDVTSDNEDLKKILDFANENLNTTISFVSGDNNDDKIAELSPKVMMEWIDSKGKSSEDISESNIKKHIQQFLDTVVIPEYCQKEMKYTFEGHNGTETISGGIYKSDINVKQEVESIYNDIRNGVNAKHILPARTEPEKIEGTFIELSKNAKMLFFHKDNAIVASCPIDIKGDISGVYQIDNESIEGVDNKMIIINDEWAKEITKVEDGTPVIIY